jgi:hypothetical protein
VFHGCPVDYGNPNPRSGVASNSITFHNKFWEELIACFPFIMRRIEKDASNNSIFALVFIAAVIFLPRCCLVAIMRYTYRHKDCGEGFMKYAFGMGSGPMIYIPNFIKTG